MVSGDHLRVADNRMALGCLVRWQEVPSPFESSSDGGSRASNPCLGAARHPLDEDWAVHVSPFNSLPRIVLDHEVTPYCRHLGEAELILRRGRQGYMGSCPSRRLSPEPHAAFHAGPRGSH